MNIKYEFYMFSRICQQNGQKNKEYVIFLTYPFFGILCRFYQYLSRSFRYYL